MNKSFKHLYLPEPQSMLIAIVKRNYEETHRSNITCHQVLPIVAVIVEEG